MVRTRRRRRRRSRKTAVPKDYVVASKSYGKALKGVRIYFEGRRPGMLSKDGKVSFGKNILEELTARFERFRWIITENTDAITMERGIFRVRTSQRLLRKMGSELIQRNRDIKQDIIGHFFSTWFPDHFTEPAAAVFVPGSLAKTLGPDVTPKLSAEDKEALNRFLPDYIASESIGSVNLLKASAQIRTLRELAEDLAREIDREHPESWWQTYVKSKITLMQQGYIKVFDKLNIGIVDTKFPDFMLVTHDNYIDILEIKKPNTSMLKHDSGRDNYFFDPEVSKAIIQTENYLVNVARQDALICQKLKDKFAIDLRAVRPRGIILVGDTRRFRSQKEKDDFRLLSQSVKNVTLLTYDELLTRLQNYIAVLDAFTEVGHAGKDKSAGAKYGLNNTNS